MSESFFRPQSRAQPRRPQSGYFGDKCVNCVAYRCQCGGLSLSVWTASAVTQSSAHFVLPPQGSGLTTALTVLPDPRGLRAHCRTGPAPPLHSLRFWALGRPTERGVIRTGVSYQPVLEMLTWFKVSAKGFTKWPANRVNSPFSFSAMQSAKL